MKDLFGDTPYDLYRGTPPHQRHSPTSRTAADQIRQRMDIIRREVCRAFRISQVAITSHRRTMEVVWPRHIYCYLCHRLTDASLPQIGRWLANRDHTTILHAVRKAEARIAMDDDFAVLVRGLESAIRKACGEGVTPGRHGFGRYVPHHRVEAYLRIGWTWTDYMNIYGVLMVWLCDCRYVEPVE